jgi:hypothetical protein
MHTWMVTFVNSSDSQKSMPLMPGLSSGQLEPQVSRLTEPLYQNRNGGVLAAPTPTVTGGTGVMVSAATARVTCTAFVTTSN